MTPGFMRPGPGGRRRADLRRTGAVLGSLSLVVTDAEFTADMEAKMRDLAIDAADEISDRFSKRGRSSSEAA
jgi:hypothetical protein